MAKKGKVASVLAFEKKLIPSDGTMEGTLWAIRHKKSTPLALKEKSIKGTISNRLKAEISKDPIKLNAKIENSNLQLVDNCALSKDQDTLKLSFTLKVLSGVQHPSVCNDQDFNDTLTEAVEDYIKRTGCTELAKRYAINIANGRFLWRNRIGTGDIEVIVTSHKQGNNNWEFNSFDYHTRNFDCHDEKITSLANEIAATLSGKNEFLLLDIVSFTKMGRAQDVYPSEELVLDKGQRKDSKGNKSKILYQTGGVAAMHSQKIGNALRTIDTWYPDYETYNIGPIASEPYGAMTNRGMAFRSPSAKADFFTLFDRFSTGGELDKIEDEHYVMSVLIRGGVFGESDKE